MSKLIKDRLDNCNKKGRLYLGLYDSINNSYVWIDHIINNYKNLSQIDIPPFTINNGKKKQPISRTLRIKVNSYNCCSNKNRKILRDPVKVP